MAKKKNEEREQVEVRFEADNRLYGDIDDAIRYLAEVRKEYAGVAIRLDQHWTGYEDMEMTFVYYRDETDDEMERRLEEERFRRELAAEQARQQKQRKVDLKELDRLRRKLGISTKMGRG